MSRSENRARTGEIAVLGGVAVLLLLPLRTPVNVYDEGNLLVAAQRLLGGDVPYRDFWGVYPPGQLLAVAGVLRLAGHEVMGPRVLDAATRFATAIVSFLLIRLVAGRALALCAALTVGVALAAVGRHYLYPVQPAMLLALLAIFLWLKRIRTVESSEDRRLALGSGGLLGLSALFRWDIASYAAAGLLVSGLLASFDIRSKRAAHARRGLLLGGGSALAVTLVGYGATAAVSGPASLVAQVFEFPATGLHEARRLALPRPWHPDLDPTSTWAQFYLAAGALLVLCAAAAALVVRFRRELTPRQHAVLILTVFAVAALAQGLSRSDRSHLLPTTLLGALALLVLVSEGREKVRLLGPLTRLLPLVAVIVLAAVCFTSLRIIVRDALRYPPIDCLSTVQGASCVGLAPDQQAAVAFVRASSRPDEKIFVANRQNTRINVNDSSFYFLADRQPATPYEELHPGVADTAAVQNQIVQDLQSETTRWVVLVAMPDSHEPNLSSRGQGVTVLDDYLRGAYSPRFTSGTYEVLELQRPAGR